MIEISKEVLVLVVFDGPNCAGKSTIIENIYQNLSFKYDVFKTCEPTKDKFGDYIKYNQENYNPLSYLFLVTANRSEHYFNEIVSNNKKIILCDRYISTSLAIQSYFDIPIEFIWEINKFFQKPDVTFFISASNIELSNRLNLRREKTYIEKKLSREQEIDSFYKAYEFMKNKGCNVYWIINNECNYQVNIKFIIDIIEKMVNADVS